jgi:hypothetical protein
VAYILEALDFFREQFEELSPDAAKTVERKLLLAKESPFHNKAVRGFGMPLFRIRFQDNHKEKRVIYLVDRPAIVAICILDRDKDYKNLRPLLVRLGYL